MSIIGIDMHIRDERVLARLRERAGESSIQIPAHEIAREFGCHVNTAQAILRRLRGAGFLVADTTQFRGGHFYRVKTIHE